MKIEPMLREGIVLRDGRPVWRRFRVSAEHVVIEPAFDPEADGRPGHALELEVAVDERGVPRCRSFTVRAHDNGPEVTGETLRRLPVRTLVRDATARVAAQWRLSEAQGEDMRLVPASPSEGLETYRALLEDARRPRRGSPITDDHLRQVADLYRTALARGDAPTQTVADSMHVVPSTAGRWVKRARERGFLGPTTPGRASA